MASQPLRRALVNALSNRAKVKLGSGATPLDYVESWVRAGQTIQALARDLATDLGRPVSRKFVSFVCNRLTADARSRIHATRLAAARDAGRTARETVSASKILHEGGKASLVIH